jgi:ribonuclease PH
MTRPFGGYLTLLNRDWNDFAENLRISFESLICREVYPKCEINILVSVIQADGSNLIDEFILILCCIGTKSAIFNAICLALLDAGLLKDILQPIN